MINTIHMRDCDCRNFDCGDCDDRNSDAGPDYCAAADIRGDPEEDRRPGYSDPVSDMQYRSRRLTQNRVPITFTGTAWKSYKSGQAGLGRVALGVACDVAAVGLLGAYIILSGPRSGGLVR